nr:capsid protein [Picobirnavirus sp.]
MAKTNKKDLIEKEESTANLKTETKNVNSKVKTDGKGKNNGSRDNNRNSGKRRGTNDPSWYAYSAVAASDNATLNFGTQAGAPFSYDVTNVSGSDSSVMGYIFSDKGIISKKSFPGILAIHWQPVIGRYDSREAPINQAAFELYTNTRMKAKITYKYDAPDLMKYVLTMTSMYALYAHLNRIYGIVNLYNRENNYVPRALGDVLGVDLQDIATNMSDYRAWLNNQAFKLSKFAIPESLYIAARWITVMSNVYTDSDSTKSQLYVHVPEYFWQYSEETGDVTAKYWIDWQNSGTTYKKKTYADIVAYWNDLMSPLFNNQDFNEMSANISLAYSPALVTMPIVDVNYMVLPVKDEGMLLQIQNGRAVGHLQTPTIQTNTTTNGLEMKSSVYYPAPKWRSGPGMVWTQLFNTDATRTSPLDVLEGSVNLVIADNETISISDGHVQASYNIKDTGPDVISCYQIFYNGSSDGEEFSLKSTVPFTSSIAAVTNTEDPEDAVQMNDIITKLSNFDWHPIIRVSTGAIVADGDVSKFGIQHSDVLCDIDNYALVSRQISKNIHDLMMLSVFRIPEVKNI